MNRRRGVFLVEMLTVLFMVGVGGALMAVGFASMMKSQKRVSDFGNQRARIEDLLDCFRNDVRSGTTALLRAGAEPVLVLSGPAGQISYRCFGTSVERTSRGVSKLWNQMPSVLSLVNPDQDGIATAVSISLYWPRTDSQDPEPNRRFDVVVQCAGALNDAED